LNSSITTSDSSNTAIVLIADRNRSAGDAGGGNIIVSGGSLSTGAGGRATLYTGSVAGSTGLTALLGSGSGRFRYNSDEAAANYSLALGSGIYAIYREHPTLTVTAPTPAAITYGDVTPTLVALVSNLQNGDTQGQAFSSGPSISIGGTTSASGHLNAGSHTLTAAAVDQLGYGLSFASGSLTVNQKPVSVTADNVIKGFGTPDNLSYSTTALASGDTTSTVLSGSLARTSGESVGLYTVNQGSLAVADSNYNLAGFNPGSLKIVPLVEPWQPTTLFAQAGTVPSPVLPSQLALLDSQQDQPRSVHTFKADSPGTITWLLGSGNGPAVSIVAGGVCMPDDTADRQ
jgi:hypothetical protein